MNTFELYSRFYFLYLIIGLMSFSLVGLDVLFKLYPTSEIQIGLPTSVRNVFIALFYAGHYFFLRDLFEKKEIFNVEELLQYVLIAGLIVLSIIFSSNLLVQYKIIADPLLKTSIQFNNLYFLIIYFLFAITLYKKLFYIKRTKNDILAWNVLQIVLIIAMPLSFLTIVSIYVVYAILSVGFILVLFITLKLRWIALLDRREKWIVLVLQLLVCIVSVVLAKNLLDIDTPYILSIDIFRNIFVLLIVSSVVIYSTFSFLALAFHLPIASVMEEREAEMHSFQEINQIIQGKFNKDDIINKLFTVTYRSTKAEGGWVNIEDNLYDYKYYDHENVTEDLVGPMNSILKIFEFSSKHHDHIYVSNILKDDSFNDLKASYRSFVYFPITVNKQLIGKLVLLKTFVDSFDEYMIRLTKTYIDQAQLALENGALIEERLETERLKEELEIAKSVQKKLLPSNIPENEFFEIACFNEPALEVGGDYYDFYEVDNGKYIVIIADVSGKGTTAAFHMAEMKGVFESLVQLRLPHEEFIMRTNNAISNCLEKNAFITLTYFYIDAQKKEITYYRAGQCPILYYNKKKNEIIYLEDEGIALGIIRDQSFKQYIKIKNIEFGYGDVIVLYTDGVIEAKDHTNKEYGDDRLKDCIMKHKNKTANEINKYLLEDLGGFSKDALSFDDVTLITLKFK